MKLDWKTCFRICTSVFVLYICIQLLPGAVSLATTLLGAAVPLFTGCVIAYVVNILMSFFEEHYFPSSGKAIVVKSRRMVCMVGAIITLIAVVALVVVLIVPQLTACVQLLIAEIPDAIDAFVATIEKLNILPQNIINTLESIDWQSRITQIIKALTDGLGNVMNVVVAAVTSIVSGIVTAFIGIIFAVYLLMGKDKISRQADKVMKRYLKKSWYKNVRHVIAVTNDCFRRYIVGQCTEAVILGILCALGMAVLQLPYAAMIGALIAFTALIPVAGAYIGGAVGAFMIFTVSPVKAVIFLVFLVILQQIEGNVIYPRVVGSSMGLPGIWVLVAVTLGGGLMGIMGMLVGVPLAAAVYRLLKEDVDKEME